MVISYLFQSCSKIFYILIQTYEQNNILCTLSKLLYNVHNTRKGIYFSACDDLYILINSCQWHYKIISSAMIFGWLLDWYQWPFYTKLTQVEILIIINTSLSQTNDDLHDDKTSIPHWHYKSCFWSFIFYFQVKQD